VSGTGRTGRGLLAAVRFYQRAVSPALPPRCRFSPTCSAYAAEAIELHGAGRGSWLAVRRLAKCAPWHPGGVDLVPPRRPDPAGGPGGTGTTGPTHSSCTTAPSAAPISSGARRPDRAPRPDPGRTPQQEAGVA
jgi:putative membrane protein insertion efficiency factor